MKILFLIFLMTLNLDILRAENIGLSGMRSPPAKKRRITPYQEQIEKCFGDMLPEVTKIRDNKMLYVDIAKIYTLQASETTYREVVYTMNSEKRKLKFDDDIVQFYKVEAEGALTPSGTDNLSADSKSNGLRYKISSRETRINQLLSGAQIESDFMKTTEYRSKQLILNLIWNDSKIKNLNVQFEGGKKSLECEQKETSDLCTCRE